MREPEIEAACHGLTACESCEIRGLVLFAGLESADFSGIHLPIQDMWLPPGSVLYRSGDRAEYLYTVREGLIKLEQSLSCGTNRIVNLLSQGHVSGLEAMAAEHYEHTAVALQSSAICKIPKAVVVRLAPKLLGQLMKKCHESVVNTQECLRELTSGSARQRVARLFLLLPAITKTRCHLFGRDDVAALLGVTTETASRTVSDLKRAGAVVEVAPNIFDLNVSELERIASGKTALEHS